MVQTIALLSVGALRGFHSSTNYYYIKLLESYCLRHLYTLPNFLKCADSSQLLKEIDALLHVLWSHKIYFSMKPA